MQAYFTHILPPGLLKFVLVILFSFLIGLEQRRNHTDEEYNGLFGTDRTFALIGILGFILYVIGPQTLMPFLGGGLVLSGFLGIFYFQKIQLQKQFGLTTVFIALVTYCLTPILYTQNIWMALLIVVCVLILTEIKQELFLLSKRIANDEFITLGKFIVLAGVILPLLPDSPISAEITVSPYRIWLAIVVVSGISYLSYLLKKFVFPNAGILLTGILGGLYSSTATTIILAKESKGNPDFRILPAIIAATTMMYLRIFLLALFFNSQIAIGLLPAFIVFIIVSSALAFYFNAVGKNVVAKPDEGIVKEHDNPLEFKTAVVFGVLFVFFAVVTTYVTKSYGDSGVNVLSFIVGVTDIDPFIINLFQSKLAITNGTIIVAVLSAISSNNLLKLIYSLVLSDRSMRVKLIISFGTLIVLGLVLAYVAPLHHLLMGI